MPATMIDRASAADLMQQASGHGSAPMQVAGVLVLHGRPSPDEVRAAIADRIRAVPRLRRRLVRAPFGAGRPVWVDDPAFVARADLAAVRSVAHVHGGTVNDVVLAAVTGALREVLAGRGEVVDRFVISVPVSPRRRTDAARRATRSASFRSSCRRPVTRGPGWTASHGSSGPGRRPRRARRQHCSHP